jgi:hypothetical protein
MLSGASDKVAGRAIRLEKLPDASGEVAARVVE